MGILVVFRYLKIDIEMNVERGSGRWYVGRFGMDGTGRDGMDRWEEKGKDCKYLDYTMGDYERCTGWMLKVLVYIYIYIYISKMYHV